MMESTVAVDQLDLEDVELQPAERGDERAGGRERRGAQLERRHGERRDRVEQALAADRGEEARRAGVP